MDEYLSKPIRADDLARALSALDSTDGVTSEVHVSARLDRPLSIIDFEQFDSLDDLGVEAKTNILQHFLDDIAGRLDAIRAEVARGDLDAVAFLAHKLRGSSGTIGGAALAAVCAEVEHTSRAGDTVSIEVLTRLAGQTDHLVTALRRQMGPEGVGARV